MNNYKELEGKKIKLCDLRLSDPNDPVTLADFNIHPALTYLDLNYLKNR